MTHSREKISRGFLDLTPDFENREKSIRILEGEWEFYWMSLGDDWKSGPVEYAEVGKSWMGLGKEQGVGYATYRLRIRLPESEVGNIYTLNVRQAGGAAQKILLNGKNILELGKVAKLKEDMFPSRKNSHVTFTIESCELELIFELSNFYHYDGGFWYPPELGRYEQIIQSYDQNFIVDSIITGATFILILINIIIYLFIREEKILLFFGIFCIPLMIYMLTFNSGILFYLFPNISFKNSYILAMSFVLITPLYMVYLNFLIDSPIKKIYEKWILYSLLFAFSLVVLLPPETSSLLTIPFIISSEILLLGLLLILSYKFFIKKENIGLYLFANIVLLSSSLSDALTNYSMIRAESFMKYSFVLFLILQVIVIARSYSAKYTKVKSLTTELLEINTDLEKKIKERTEEYKIQKEKAENENLWKDKFISLVTHDLRSPLTSILLSHDIILSSPENQELVLNELGKTRELVVNSISMVKHLLCMSRFQKKDIKLKFSDVDLYEIYEYMCNDFSFELDRKKITLRENIPGDTIITVDEIIFKEIIRNIIMNSIKFSYEGSDILIEYRETAEEQRVILSDTGIGMDQSTIEDILTRKKDLKAASGTGQGYGMGLKLSLDFLDLHNGKMEIKSTRGIGTLVEIILPSNKRTVILYSESRNIETILESLRKKILFPVQVNSVSELERVVQEIHFEVLFLDPGDNKKEIIDILNKADKGSTLVMIEFEKLEKEGISEIPGLLRG